MDSLCFYIRAYHIPGGQNDVQKACKDAQEIIDANDASLTVYGMHDEGISGWWFLVLLGTTNPAQEVMAQIQRALAKVNANVIETTPAFAQWFIEDYIARQVKLAQQRENSDERTISAPDPMKGKQRRGRRNGKKKRKR